MAGMLIFVCILLMFPGQALTKTQSDLFSASLTAFLIEGYKTLQPDPGDATVVLLKFCNKSRLLPKQLHLQVLFNLLLLPSFATSSGSSVSR